MVGFPLTFAAQVTLPNTPPALEQASLSLPSGDFSLRFDQVLHAQPVDPSTLTFRVNNFQVSTLTAVASGRFVTGTTNVIAGAPQPDDCSYTASPAHIRNAKLVPAAAFANQPLSIT